MAITKGLQLRAKFDALKKRAEKDKRESAETLKVLCELELDLVAAGVMPESGGGPGEER